MYARQDALPSAPSEVNNPGARIRPRGLKEALKARKRPEFHELPYMTKRPVSKVVSGSSSSSRKNLLHCSALGLGGGGRGGPKIEA